MKKPDILTEIENARGGQPDIDTRLDNFDTSLAEKAQQTDVNTALALKRDKSVKMQIEDMSDTVISAISGGTTVSVLSVPQNESVDNSKLSNILLDKKFRHNLINIKNIDLLSYISANLTGAQSLTLIDDVNSGDKAVKWDLAGVQTASNPTMQVPLTDVINNKFIKIGDTVNFEFSVYCTGITNDTFTTSLELLDANGVHISYTSSSYEITNNKKSVVVQFIVPNNFGEISFVTFGNHAFTMVAYFSDFVIRNMSTSFIDALHQVIYNDFNFLNDTTIPLRNKKPVMVNLSGDHFQYDEETNLLHINANPYDSSWITNRYYINDIGGQRYNLQSGDIVEVVLTMKATATNLCDIRTDADANSNSISLIADNQYHTYKMRFTVGTDVVNYIELFYQLTWNNVDAYISEFYCRKYNADTYEADLLRERIYDYIQYIQSKEIRYTTLEVSKDYNASTIGWGITKFNNLITAHNTITRSSYNDRYIIKVYPGTYNEWETVWVGNDVETGTTYFGITVKDYVYFESSDIEHPENYILSWDGSVGFSISHDMTSNQTARRCLFHITNPSTHTHIKGFTLRAKNNRYCIHPESAGQGKDGDWSIENCIFDWLGCPNSTTYSGNAFGIGISDGEIGLLKNIKFLNQSATGGSSGHNNGWDVTQGTKPFISQGANLTFENCNFNGNNFRIDTFKDDTDTFDIVHFINCKNINNASFNFQGVATVQKWRSNVVTSDITTNQMI